MPLWTPIENPGTRPPRSWAFDIGCALFAAVASFGSFSFAQAAHPAHPALAIGLYTVAATMSRATAPAAPALVVVWVFGAANAGRRTYNGRLLLPVMRAVPMRAWASGRMRRSGCRAAPGWRRLRLWRAIATSRSLEASAR